MAFDAGLALSGASTGASAGAAFGPIGAGVGALAGLGLGLMGQDKPDIPPPPAAVDPRMLGLLEEYKAKRTAIESGLSTEFQLGRELLGQAQTAQLEGVARLTGGDVGAAIAGAERATAGIAGDISKLTGTATSQAMQYTALIDRLTQAISQRAMDVATTQWSVARGEYADVTKVQNQNLINALTSPGVTGTLTQTVTGISDYIEANKQATRQAAQPRILSALLSNPAVTGGGIGTIALNANISPTFKSLAQ